MKRFDPLDYVGKKDLKKMGRFIFFAIAGAEFALKASRLAITPAVAERVGVHIGSGIGGFDVIEREVLSSSLGAPANANIFSNLQHLSPCADASVSSLCQQRSRSRVATIGTR